MKNKANIPNMKGWVTPRKPTQSEINLCRIALMEYNHANMNREWGEDAAEGKPLTRKQLEEYEADERLQESSVIDEMVYSAAFDDVEFSGPVRRGPKRTLITGVFFLGVVVTFIIIDDKCHVSHAEQF